MKIIRKNIERDSSGTIVLYPEEPEDIWHSYNLIQEGDLVKASTIRRVQNESSTGITSQRGKLYNIHMYL
ncbi:unnamed protein product [Pneumocystis jirovecii]|uniref:Pelota N-terminal domain-containing protein n=1 Tax=Pneumocystis jirovecii TaxID=42068 RepID=L0P9D8_PNEJI|nr:unnamed protein product [Pneumocystis jirovecii]